MARINPPRLEVKPEVGDNLIQEGRVQSLPHTNWRSAQPEANRCDTL